MNNESVTSERGTFPFDDWCPALREKYFGRGVPTLSFFGNELRLPSPGSVVKGDECAALLLLKQERTKDRQREIIGQVWKDDFIGCAVTRPLTDAGVSQEALSRAEELASDVLDLIDPPIYNFKDYFNRARPWNCCGPQLQPLFPKGSDRYPGHPSYPSGHSTQAHTLAHLFTRLYPALEKNLFEIAARIAVNREVAGLHFASDSAVGKVLGKALAEAIINAPREHQDNDWQRLRLRIEALCKAPR